MSDMTDAALPTPLPPAPPSPRRAPAPKAQSNVKETVEQILIAFILAFIFRCFVVEAFVIPTGSMAPTLLGAHLDYRCPDCGWHWSVNYSSDSDDSVPARARETFPIRCPNCGYKLPRVVPGEPDNGAAQPPVRFGDRILVQKYIYLLHPPERWDVVVFKTPDKPNPNSEVEPFTQNYIKRLVGRPGETIMVLDGDIYVGPSDRPFEQLTPEDFVVQTKPKEVQDALWRIVYDADYRPRGLDRIYGRRREVSDPSVPGGVRVDQVVEKSDAPWRDPWTPAGTGWRAEGRDYRFENAAGTGTIKFDAAVTPERHAMTDWLGYDVTHYVGRGADAFLEPGYDTIRRNDPLNNVSDVKLAATYQRLSGDGAMRMNLTKQEHRFTAEFTPTKVRLLMTRDGTSAPVELGAATWSPGTALHAIEFTNVDYRVAIRVDGRELLASTPDQFAPDVKGLIDDFKNERHQQSAAAAWIDADRQSCVIRHLSLWRDVYYLNRDWGYINYYWGMPDSFPTGDSDGHLIRLGPDEYFTMGDNSMMSADARVWRFPIKLPQEGLDVESGRVPGRFLLGRAFFVYWPAGYAPVSGIPAFVPNFGEMRFIH